MKNQIKFLLLVVVLAFGVSSCEKDRAFNEFETIDQFDESPTDDFTDDDSGDDHGHSDEVDESTLATYRIVNGELEKIKDHQVANHLLAYQQDLGRHQAMWDFYKKLFPADQVKFIKEFDVFYGNNDLAGFVSTIDSDNSRWKLGLAIELNGDLDQVILQDDFTYVCIHEQAHILTLNSTQLEQEFGVCNEFELQEGCAKENAYINRLFELGWADIYDEYSRIQSDDEAQDFYNKYSTRFVSNYAATNPAEDIAEVFTYYVTMDQLPTGNSIADQKIRLLSEFPELVELREQIRKDPAVGRLKPGAWKSKVCKHKHKFREAH